jgi:hypothetical protein
MFRVIVTELLLKLSFSNKTIGNLEIILRLFPNSFPVNLLALKIFFFAFNPCVFVAILRTFSYDTLLLNF